MGSSTTTFAFHPAAKVRLVNFNGPAQLMQQLMVFESLPEFVKHRPCDPWTDLDLTGKAVR
jgi:hypothetical protein